MNNALSLWQSPNGINLPANTINTNEIIDYINPSIVPQRDINQIKVAYQANLYPMAAEFTWERAINFLKMKIMGFGRDFVLEMLGRSDDNLSEDFLTDIDTINLATDLGFINQTAKVYFLQTKELIQHFKSPHIEDEMDMLDSLRTTKNCIKFVLGLEDIELELSYNNFRERLVQEILNEDDQLIKNLIIGPYFYKRTTVRTLLNLSKKIQDGAEKEKVLSNTVMILPLIWDGLLSEDKWPVGFAYAEAANVGKRDLLKTFKSVLLKVQGFDFVPENLRSTSFIDMANKLIDTHYSFNNFYREPVIAEQLLQMGSSIPKPAIGRCMTAVVLCKVGNKYGKADGAQAYLDSILGNLVVGSWSYFLKEVLPGEESLLIKLNDQTMFKRWTELVINYNLNEIQVGDGDLQKLLKNSFEKNFNSAKGNVNSLLNKLR